MVREEHRAGPLPDTVIDRDSADQFVLPLVVRIERTDPPRRTDALEAAARAVLELLNDPRSRAGEWAAAVRGWQQGRIRKVVRRARGAAWSRAEALPGLTVTAGTAQVRVHPPVPVDGWPPDLVKLQVGGTELADPVPAALPEPPAEVPVLWLNPGLEMTAGKAMAQVGHGAQLIWWASDRGERTRWAEAGFPLAARTPTAADWAQLVTVGLPTVRDGGFTEIEPGSLTVVGDAPWLPTR
jgi:peptidyl-tRNA hydrolase